jgi:hypothetical protein
MRPGKGDQVGQGRVPNSMDHQTIKGAERPPFAVPSRYGMGIRRLVVKAAARRERVVRAAAGPAIVRNARRARVIVAGRTGAAIVEQV